MNISSEVFIPLRDDLDFFERQAVQRINQLVDLPLQRANIKGRSAWRELSTF